jgi:transcriptional regulator with GAF, ATPase, and Fis domain
MVLAAPRRPAPGTSLAYLLGGSGGSQEGWMAISGVRLCVAGCVGTHERDEFCEALRRAGHEVAGPDDRDPRLPSVIVFAGAPSEALDLVRVQRTLADERLLVVALGDDRLERGAAHQLIAAGAADVLVRGAGEPGLDRLAARVAARLARWAAIDALLATEAVAQTLIGTSATWNRVLRQIVEVARFTDAPVLITGETGTGKELVSRLIHELDPRTARRELVVLDCTTIVPELSGSEFFGHEKGSFTGAVAARNGAFALADDGTLFLDEVGELPLLLQAELLRVIQEHSYKRVGGSVWQTTSFRLVCATNRDLAREQAEGRFRADLFYRISGWTFHLPPLRERREDIPALVRHFLREQLGARLEIDDAVLDHMVRREYRGNIRELRQLCTRIAHRHVGPGPVTLGDLGGDLAHDADDSDEAWCDPSFHRAIAKAVALGVGLKEIGRIAEDAAVRLAVHRENGSLQHAARRLGVTDRALQLRRASARAAELGAPNGKLG